MRITNHMAILRNLRNISQAGVSQEHIGKIEAALESPDWARGARRILPFRYIAAARAAPQFERSLDKALCATVATLPRLSGVTAVLVDVSGSMNMAISGKSDLTRMDAAAALAAMVPGDIRLFTFSDRVVEVPPRVGMAGVDAIINSQGHSGTRLVEAVQGINALIKYDRIIVVSDEQAAASRLSSGYSSAAFPAPNGIGYLINVASNERGVGYGHWIHIDGFSESIFKYIAEHERSANDNERLNDVS